MLEKGATTVCQACPGARLCVGVKGGFAGGLGPRRSANWIAQVKLVRALKMSAVCCKVFRVFTFERAAVQNVRSRSRCEFVEF